MLVFYGAASQTSRANAPGYPPSLREAAARRGCEFGSMVDSEQLKDSQLRDLVLQQCSIVTPGDELKWRSLEPQKGSVSYEAADAIVNFARSRNIKLRGHTLAWHVSVPWWAQIEMQTAGNANSLYTFVSNTVTRYKGQVEEWDVVNEAIEPSDGLSNGLRNSILHKYGGEEFIGRCFRIARSADPDARLIYNEYGLEYASPGEDERRRCTLLLLKSLLKERVPIDGLGIQCHLKVGNNFDQKRFRDFLAEVASLGLKITLTEIDVDDSRIVSSFSDRDKEVAEHLRSFLDVALSQQAVRRMIFWGLSDKYSWLNTSRKRTDGLTARALVYDDQFQRKRAWFAIEDALAGTLNR